MEQRRFSLVISVTIHLGLRLMLKRTTRRPDKMHWTGWMKSETQQLPARRFINKIFVAITAVGLEPEPFKKEIWCFDSFKIKPICISYLHLGKDRSWSAKICTMGHTIRLIFESIRTHVSQKRRPAGHGT